jgi:type I restriction enzyme R subunit
MMNGPTTDKSQRFPIKCESRGHLQSPWHRSRRVRSDSAVKVLGDDALRTIARELVATVRANVTIDWTVRDNVRAQLRVLVKRIRKYGYPPDMQEKATQTVLEQAEVFSEGWAAS